MDVDAYALTGKGETSTDNEAYVKMGEGGRMMEYLCIS